MGYVPAPLPEKLTVAGISVEMWRDGSGQPLLFLHGGEGIDPRARFLEGLSQHFDVIAVSHPGFGHSGLGDGFGHIDDLAYFYLDLIRLLELRNLLLVGVSFGGWLAAEIIVKSDEAISGLVMVDALGVKLGPPDQRDIVDVFTAPRELIAELSFSDPAKGFGQASGSEEFLALARNRDALSLYGWLPYMYNPKLKARLHRVRVPTQFLWGEQDRIALPAYGRAYSRLIAGAHFALIPQAGHYPHVERPDAFVDAVVHFAGPLQTRKPTAASRY